ncbi:MAG: hypothetical protein AAFP03_07780 [Cyanobacteria bacterium J06598_3]
MSISKSSNNEPPTLIRVTQVLVAVLGLGFFSLVGVVAGSFYWSAYVSATPAKNWNGCAAPHSEAERQAWIANLEAAGETLCEPGLIEQELTG